MHQKSIPEKLNVHLGISNDPETVENPEGVLSRDVTATSILCLDTF